MKKRHTMTATQRGIIHLKPEKASFIDQPAGSFDWYWVSRYASIPIPFIIKYYEKIDWFGLSYNNKFSEFIRSIAWEVFKGNTTQKQACKLLKSNYAKVIDKL